jgi:putative membrane protein
MLASGGILRVAAAAVGFRLTRASQNPSIGIWALAAAIVHLVTMTLWHVPSLYELALREPEYHHVEHLTMLGTAFLAWAAILAAADSETRVLGAIAGLAPLAIGGAAVGVLLLAAPDPLYPTYLATPVDPLTDQRVAGALMKVGALLVYVVAAAGIAARWLQRLDSREAGRHQPQASV